ncbi:MAG: hypothetical protein NTW21_28175 [Verrucomicrobia bacterium]|nr:hypothetical protein [Verrucomicrobiota bacterium]
MIHTGIKVGTILAATAAIMALPAMADVKVVGTESGGSPMKIMTDFGKVVDAANIGGRTLKCDGVSLVGRTVPENTTASQNLETTPFKVTLSTQSGNLASVVLSGEDALL